MTLIPSLSNCVGIAIGLGLGGAWMWRIGYKAGRRHALRQINGALQTGWRRALNSIGEKQKAKAGKDERISKLL